MNNLSKIETQIDQTYSKYSMSVPQKIEQITHMLQRRQQKIFEHEQNTPLQQTNDSAEFLKLDYKKSLKISMMAQLRELSQIQDGLLFLDKVLTTAQNNSQKLLNNSQKQKIQCLKIKQHQK
ncbi:Hypothetical_protein [Hexamita inflata]|uniref:Hypothetical_protein n=1 Tax=Hexamita inflata TaxID=28002 RepID=A0AA86RGE9_9EUKA|nr:Hypothetical protein HINF_LOCUS34384 [Hexamita inflata]CAI9976027.1 Hypothetical protein HINF_LOCUS63672 [Hexamita inflata]